jgi:hypothetical protein
VPLSACAIILCAPTRVVVLASIKQLLLHVVQLLVANLFDLAAMVLSWQLILFTFKGRLNYLLKVVGRNLHLSIGANIKRTALHLRCQLVVVQYVYILVFIGWRNLLNFILWAVKDL